MGKTVVNGIKFVVNGYDHPLITLYQSGADLQNEAQTLQIEMSALLVDKVSPTDHK